MPSVRTIPVSHYYSGQGNIIMGERDPVNGRPVKAYKIGNAPTAEIQISTTQVDHKESMSGQRAVDLTMLTEKSATLNLTIESLDLKNLVSAMYGNIASINAGTVTAEAHTVDSSANGGVTILRNNQVSSVVVTASGGGTPVPASAYFLDEDFGTIQWNPEYTPAITGSITVAYEHKASERLEGLTSVAPPERFLRFEGINTVDDTLYLVEIPRAMFQPLQSFPLITEEIAQVQMTATILPDPFINTGSKYFRATRITPEA